MTIPRCYSAGWERKTHEVLGRKLHPLTLDHARVLYLADSPYVTGSAGATATGQDLLVAVAICSRPEPPTYEELPLLVQEALTMTGDIQSAFVVFKEYAGYWLSPHPRFTKKESQSRVPWPWMYAAVLMSEFGMTEREAWATTCADAMWRVAAIAVFGGNTEYATAEQIEGMEIVRNG